MKPRKIVHDWRNLASQLAAMQIVMIDPHPEHRSHISTLRLNAQKALFRETGRQVIVEQFDDKTGDDMSGSFLLATFADDPTREKGIADFLEGYCDGGRFVQKHVTRFN